MKAEDLSFTFRDVARYIVPGSVALALALWFLSAFAGIQIEISDINLGESILFLLGAYVSGHILHVLGVVFLKSPIDKMVIQFVRAIRKRDLTIFTPEFYVLLDECVQKHLRVPLSSEESYYLCQIYIRGDTTASERERYVSLSGLYAGILMADWLGLVMSALVVVKQIALLMLPAWNVVIPVTLFLDYQEAHLIAGIVIAIVCALLLRPLRAETEILIGSFVVDTFWTLYAVCARKEAEKIA